MDGDRAHRRRMTNRTKNTATTHHPAPRDRAVVLGGSFAGLLAARVLADHFAEVLVVDRDGLDGLGVAGDLPRRGVPQGTQVHGLLVGGFSAVERLLPGYAAGLAARGANVGDVATGADWWFPFGRLARPTTASLTGVTASRPLLEGEIRRRVTAIPNVRLLGSTDVAGIAATPDGTRVTGARLVSRSPGSAAAIVPADLVVDATGRGSRTPTWLADLGYPAPPEERLELNITYVSRLFAVRPGDTDANAVVVTLRPPDPRTGVLLRQEGGRWLLTVAARLGDPAPMDIDGFRAFARTLPAPELAAVAEREPLTDAVSFRYRTSRWRHYERCERLPAGLVVLGDAVCSFDPTFGQGMSSAALQAEVLQRELAAGPDGLERRVARGAADVARIPWTLATGTARRLPGMPPKSFAERQLDRYLARLVGAATTDETLALAFLRVVNLLAEPSSLLAPRVVRRVLTARRPAGAPSGAVSGPHVPADLPRVPAGDLPSADGRLAG
jgi:2-polyprenyl-6-methoxyphenol hydroxylase-like FAD-dependent oxidoreductase